MLTKGAIRMNGFFHRCITCKKEFWSLRRRVKCPRCRREVKLFGIGDPLPGIEVVAEDDNDNDFVLVD